MNSIKIIGNGTYLPKRKVLNIELEDNFNVEHGYIYSRTGIKQRYFKTKESIEEMAINSVENLLEKYSIDKNEIEMIVVATTSTNKLMPGISCLIQRNLKLQECICLDILAGCSGYINGFDILRNYIALGKVNSGIVVGVEVLSEYTDNTDLSTAILLSDGAGATFLKKSNEERRYNSFIQNTAQNADILYCDFNNKIHMNGKEIYRYAVTYTVDAIKKLLHNSNINLKDIKYIVPHQSNIKIIKAIANRLDMDIEKMYINIEDVGNTFCASIPIALSEMLDKKLLFHGDKIILLGYGGGLNTGCILLEV